MATITLRNRVAVACWTGVFAVLVLALVAGLAVSYGFEQAAALQDTSEKLSLAGENAREINAELVALRIDIARDIKIFYRWLTGITAAALLLTVAVFLWVFRSVTSPINSLATVFHRLAEGSEETIEDHAVTQDEIGELYDAAEAFRLENIRERQLLSDYRTLSESLELEIERRTEELKIKNAELQRLASIDMLTGISNRRSLDRSLAEEIARAQRYKRQLAVLLVDIDFFKQVNDQHGHLTGDRVLTATTAVLRENVRAADILGRWGGEEFLVICPETSIEQARNAAEKIRLAIELADFALPRNVTISIGVAGYTAGDSPESLINSADKALYLAKKSGRNRVCVSPAPPVSTLHLDHKRRC